MGSEQKTVVVIHETALQSWGRDVFSGAVLLALVGVGWFLGSSAMQWVAAIIWTVWVVSRAAFAPDIHRVTPQEAANILKQKFGVSAQP